MAKRLLRKLAQRLLGPRWTRTLGRPYLVPRSYKQLVIENEKFLSIQRDPQRLDDGYWAAVLRKHAHVVDKGLWRADCTPGHSLNAYTAAKRALSMIHSQSVLEDPSVHWGRDVLQQHDAAQQTSARPPHAAPPQHTTCSYADLLDAIRTRRSIRTYEEREVPEEVVRKIVEVVDWSPTSCNRQPARVYATNDQNLVKQCMAHCLGATAFGSFTPLFLSFCADARPYAIPDELMLPYIDTALGIQNCCLVAHSLGISITLLSWAGHGNKAETGLRRLLGIPDECRIVVNALGGYPAHRVKAPDRKRTGLSCHGASEGSPARRAEEA